MSDETAAAPAADASVSQPSAIAQALQAAVANAQPQQQAASAAPPQAAQPAPTANPAVVQIPSDQFKARLDETRDKTRTDTQAHVLKEVGGFQTIAEAKKAFAALTEWQKSQMTEQERINADLTAAKATAQKFESRSALFERLVEAEFNKLPEAARAAIDAQANGNADDRYRLIDFMQKAGLLNAPAPAAAPAAPPVEPTPRPANAGAMPPAPKPAQTRSKLDEYNDLQKSRPMAASAFYNAHRNEIEAARASQH